MKSRNTEATRIQSGGETSNNRETITGFDLKKDAIIRSLEFIKERTKIPLLPHFLLKHTCNPKVRGLRCICAKLHPTNSIKSSQQINEWILLLLNIEELIDYVEKEGEHHCSKKNLHLAQL